MYVFERDTFVKIVTDVFGDDLIDLYRFCEEGKQTSNFFMLYDDDCYYILEKYEPSLIFWYKNLGRTAQTSFTTEEELKAFVTRLYIDLYW